MEQVDGIVESQRDPENLQTGNGPGGSKKRLTYSNPFQRQDHIAAFLTWLPNELTAAPGISWRKLPSKVMGYLMNTTSKEQDVIPVTLAVGCMIGFVSERMLFATATNLTRLFRRLRIEMQLESIQQLSSRSLWEALREHSITVNEHGSREIADWFTAGMQWYQVVSVNHLPRYVHEQLTPGACEVWQQQLNSTEPSLGVHWQDFILPPLPYRLSIELGARKSKTARERAARKERSEVLTPLHPLLVQLALLRKQALQRFVKEYQDIQARLARGEIQLPYTFVHHARIPEVNQEARTISSVEISDREVDLQLTVWDRRSWVQTHPNLKPKERHTLRYIKQEQKSYAPERNSQFVQCHSPAQDLFWFGALVQHHLLGQKARGKTTPAARQLADEAGVKNGFTTNRSGFFAHSKSMTVWLQYNTTSDHLIIDPIALYRAVLYGTCAAVVALTSGARLSEFLQISDDRWKFMEVDEVRAGKATGHVTEVVLQHLLPKGGKSDQDRQLFLISEQALPLLREIIESLEDRHGCVPIIQPTKNLMAEHLRPEPYIFQWAASPDGRLGLLDANSVALLLRFLFFGLELRTKRTGEPIRIAMHLCRHVLAETARQEHRVPWEAIAYLLHHQVSISGHGRPSIPEVTQYYADMAPTQKLAILHELHSEIARRSCTYAMRPPTKQELEEMDDALREVFEEWGTIGPVALGFCSAGLCVRPQNRALCIGCPYLVADHRKLGVARRWHKLYQRDIERLEADGLTADARQKRRDLQRLEDHMKIMELQVQVLADGGQLPRILMLSEGEDEGAPLYDVRE